MPREGGPGTTTAPEVAEKHVSMPRRMANFFIGPEEVLRREVRQGRLTAEAADQLLKEQLKKRLKTTVAPVVFGGKVAGGTLLVEGLLVGKALQLIGKGAKLALGPAADWAIHYDKNFGEGFDTAWKMTREHMGIKVKK